MDPHSLPFGVGQAVELRSFIQGYRGAWFRCEITKICLRDKDLWHAMKYIDFPDQRITWTKVYQKCRYSKDRKPTLMVRPCFPSIYSENQMPSANDISEVVVIVNDEWKVGDLVDWWTDGCYWSGKIIRKLGNEKVKIELPCPPVGEGSLYEVFCRDLRPSLDWSVSEGWKLCTAKESNHHTSSARIVKPLNQGDSQNLIDNTVSKGRNDVQPTGGPSIDHKGSASSDISAGHLLLPDKMEQLAKKSSNGENTNGTRKTTGLNTVDHSPERIICSDSVSGQYVQDSSAQLLGSFQTKKMKVDQNISLNSASSDTMEAAILDLEELISRVKWLNGILNSGMPSSNTQRNCWKFVEHHALAKPK